MTLTRKTNLSNMKKVQVAIDQELIEEAIRIQRENKEFFDEDIGDDVEALINQIICDHLQDIEDAAAIRKIKAVPDWKSKCVRIGDLTEGI